MTRLRVVRFLAYSAVCLLPLELSAGISFATDAIANIWLFGVIGCEAEAGRVGRFLYEITDGAELLYTVAVALTLGAIPSLLRAGWLAPGEGRAVERRAARWVTGTLATTGLISLTAIAYFWRHATGGFPWSYALTDWPERPGWYFLYACWVVFALPLLIGIGSFAAWRAVSLPLRGLLVIGGALVLLLVEAVSRLTGSTYLCLAHPSGYRPLLAGIQVALLAVPVGSLAYELVRWQRDRRSA